MFVLSFACVMYRKRKYEILAAAADVAAVQRTNRFCLISIGDVVQIEII